MGQFVRQFYQTALVIPPVVYIQHPLEDQELVRNWLRERREGAVRIVCPRRGQQKKLMDVVAENAVQGLAQHRIKWLNNSDVLHQAMSELEEELSLPALPFADGVLRHLSRTGQQPGGQYGLCSRMGGPGRATTAAFRSSRWMESTITPACRKCCARRFKRLAEARAEAGENFGRAGRRERRGYVGLEH